MEEWDPDGIQHFDLDTFLRICESDHFKDPMKEEVVVVCFPKPVLAEGSSGLDGGVSSI